MVNNLWIVEVPAQSQWALFVTLGKDSDNFTQAFYSIIFEGMALGRIWI